ncbi:MAG: dynamin family protein [Gemmatimonadota bacterium]|nr:dynamin family protein [Gemmatimonadota bacterium]
MTTDQRGSTALETLREVASRWDLDILADDIQRLTSGDAVQIGFLGDFNSGKSTLINELVGVEDLMPVQHEPCTARAGQVISTPSLEEPEYFRVNDEGEQTAINRPDFDDLARGDTPGRPLVRLPSRPGFPAGFVFLDTPGLSTLIEKHTEITLGELPFVDAAVICVDISKGGLTRTVTDFLTSPGVRHLQHRFLIALTFADRKSDTERAAVVEKTADILAQTIGCSTSEVEGRIVVVSAGPEATKRDVSALRTAIHEVFETRKEFLMAERHHRASVRLVPRTISLLEQVRGGLLESQENFAGRKKEADEQRVRLDQELHQQRQRFEKSRDDLRRDVQAICDHYQASFAATSDDLAIQQVSDEFTAELATKVSDHFARLGRQWDTHVGGIDAEIQRLLKDTNKIVNLGATAATAALVAAINPAAGVAATAGEATGGAALRTAAAKAATKIGVKTATTAATEGLKKVGKSVLIALHEINPVNIASDLVGEWWKNKRIAEPMDHISRVFSAQAAREIEAYFESEVFQPLEREYEEVQRALSQIESERRTDLTARNAKVSRIQADIDRLQKVGQA